MKRNKKLGLKQREAVIMDCQQKLKKDYINYYDYADLFYYEYEIINNECRNNLKKINEKLLNVDFESGDINE